MLRERRHHAVDHRTIGRGIILNSAALDAVAGVRWRQLAAWSSKSSWHFGQPEMQHRGVRRCGGYCRERGREGRDDIAFGGLAAKLYQPLERRGAAGSSASTASKSPAAKSKLPRKRCASARFARMVGSPGAGCDRTIVDIQRAPVFAGMGHEVPHGIEGRWVTAHAPTPHRPRQATPRDARAPASTRLSGAGTRCRRNQPRDAPR